MNKLYFYLFTLLLLTITSAVNSATFCVTTSAALQQAFDTAAGNNQADIIKIKIGDYIAPSGGFQYQGANENHGLEISGGWTPFFGNPCAFQLNTTSPLETILDGNSLARVLLIYAGATTDNFKVSGLTFINGFADNQYSGGLRFLSLGNFSGNFLLERSAFINNEATRASALLVDGGINNNSKLTIANNLFIGNHGEYITVYIQPNDSWGVYFTNNTLMSNTVTGNSNGGLSIPITGSASAYVANNIISNNSGFDAVLSINVSASGETYLYNNNIGTQFGTISQSANNISIPPLFEEATPSSFTYIPATNSQMIDTGIHPQPPTPLPPTFFDAWALGETDFQGNPRVQGAKVDMGAFETELIFANGFEFVNKP